MAHLISRRARLIPAHGYSFSFVCLRRLNSSRCHYSKMPPFTHKCGIDAEPLHRYKPGGYHPLQLGETLEDGRYKVIHKLGWGGYSTTWVAKDQKTDSYVAVKVKTADVKQTRELSVFQALSTLPKTHPGSSHIIQLLDHFTLDGPNGSHDCLVLELAGPNVADVASRYYEDYRLPSNVARVVAKQVLQGLDFLAVNEIGHGDLHTRNIVLDVSDLQSLSEDDFVARLGEPDTGEVTRIDGKPLEPNFPAKITAPGSFRRKDFMLPHPSIKIIDFGEAFCRNHAPNTLHTPLVVRAPEVIFGDRLDRRVDLWNAGCLIFELITGQPPFDSIMQTPPLLVKQMIQETCDDLPSRWQAKWLAMQKDIAKYYGRQGQQDRPEEDEEFTLQQWLEETYYFNNRKAEFTKEELARMAEAISSMLKFEPSRRATPSDILAKQLFH